MKTLFAKEDRYNIKTYAKVPIAVERGQGSWLYTQDQKAYLDMYGGHAVAGTGHCHPEVVEALKEQLERLIFYSNSVYLSVRAEAAQALIEKTDGLMAQLFFVNSGSEANENAIKLTRKITGRSIVISFTGGFHGRTYAAASATGIEKYRRLITPLVADHIVAPFGDLHEVERLLAAGNVAAVILEPIQSMAGIRDFGAEFLRELSLMCRKYQSYLIFDEVQTGVGRVGGFFYATKHGLEPDMITMGKAIASGVPMGALLLSEKIGAHISSGDLGSTFGGGPLAAAAASATVQVIEKQRLLLKVQEGSQKLKQALQQLCFVEEVRGEGYLLGIKVHGTAADYQKRLFARQILVGTSDDPSVLRLLPPLTLTDEEIDHFLAVCKEL
jgi:acetylornithine aminotransferase/acetylornithine/N-succinyldiaminopimelate aminotransferase